MSDREKEDLAPFESKASMVAALRRHGIETCYEDKPGCWLVVLESGDEPCNSLDEALTLIEKAAVAEAKARPF